MQKEIFRLIAKNKNITQKEMSEELNITKRTIKRINL
ncbi:MAG: winged helix-turn-helix transcriptional regulator [Clostridia bacterium]|nr:winged helix-turn-helix transcriptional regulator [Clostridium sp.]